MSCPLYASSRMERVSGLAASVNPKSAERRHDSRRIDVPRKGYGKLGCVDIDDLVQHQAPGPSLVVRMVIGYFGYFPR